jgi:hypothetical protein
MEAERFQEVFSLPEGCPIPGAIYRYQLPSGHWEFATVTALEVLPQDRWSAVFTSVRFGDERITDEVNRMDRYELHSVPNMISVSRSEAESVPDSSLDDLDLLLAIEA